MDDRKGKGIMEHGSNDSPSERARQARERRTAVRAMARASEAPYAREDGNPGGHNAPPGDVLRLGGSTSSRLELQGQQAPRDSGIRRSPPPPMACPVCLHAVFNNTTTICTVCACAEAVRIAWEFPIPMDRRCSACLSTRGWRWIRRSATSAGAPSAASSAARFARSASLRSAIIRLNPAISNTSAPSTPTSPRIFLSMPARSSSNIWQGQQTAMGNSASAVQVLRPVGPRPTSTGITAAFDRHGGRIESSSTRKGHPTALGDSASSVQVLRAAGPPPASSGITAAFDQHSGRIESSSTWKGQPTAMGDSASAVRVPRGAGPPPPPPPASTGITAAVDGHSGRVSSSTSTTPVYHDLACPACLYNTAPMLPEPWWHVCYCDTCIKVQGRVCPVCASEAG